MLHSIGTNGVRMVMMITLLAWLGAMGGCNVGAGGTGDNGDANQDDNEPTVCGDVGDGCDADAPCCAGLACIEWTCAPVDSAQDGDDGDDDDDDDGGGRAPVEHPGEVVADHTSTAEFDSIPATSFDAAKSGYQIFYGHTSHGSQIVTGMNMLDTGPGTLSLEENGDVDLGHNGDLGWVDITRDVLDRPGDDTNMVMWSWCGGVSDNTEEGINTYLDAMNQLEIDYPGVLFVYMTGHLREEGTEPEENLRFRNNQIRDYCAANDKILFDFADIESYDPDGNYYPNETDWCNWCEDWCASHSCPTGDCVDDTDCAHSMCFNCYRKGQAFWWMMARIAGWEG